MRDKIMTAITSPFLSLVFLMTTLAPAFSEDFWIPDGDERIVHQLSGETPVVMCLQGRKVVMQVRIDQAQGFTYLSRFFEVSPGRIDKTRIEFDANRQRIPDIRIDGGTFDPGAPEKVGFDGRLILTYPEKDGLTATRTVYPSTVSALVLDEWELRNTGDQPLKVGVTSIRDERPVDDEIVMLWHCPAVDVIILPPGETLNFHASVHAHLKGETDLTVNIAAERTARRTLADAAWKGPGRLETPERLLDMAFALQKLHVLESPIETAKGVITHNGSLRYSPGVWANDPVEYSSPLFPFFGDDDLNEAAMSMYRIWLRHCREHGIDPFPGSFEHAALKLDQKHRGDDAMVLYGLSKFLLFLGDRAAAEEMWPLIGFSAESVKRHTRPDGIVASKTDEMEGRYPTGDANLSTSALAYGGYRLAARLGHALKKPEAEEFDRRADALAPAIETFFGATVEGFDTYRYYDGNTTLRGWILLPLAMGITEREDATVAAMLSNKLWPNRMRGGDILAESTRPTEWGRETYYALRVLFMAGRTEEALETTRRVVKAQIFGPRGPYPDEDAIDMLCPGSLYPRVFTEGLFGIVPTGLDSFECKPWLPEEWPRMALRDMRAFGQSWDLIVEREGNQQKVTVTSGGRTLLSETGPAGKIYAVTFPKK